MGATGPQGAPGPKGEPGFKGRDGDTGGSPLPLLLPHPFPSNSPPIAAACCREFLRSRDCWAGGHFGRRTCVTDVLIRRGIGGRLDGRARAGRTARGAGGGRGPRAEGRAGSVRRAAAGASVRARARARARACGRVDMDSCGGDVFCAQQTSRARHMQTLAQGGHISLVSLLSSVSLRFAALLGLSAQAESQALLRRRGLSVSQALILIRPLRQPRD